MRPLTTKLLLSCVIFFQVKTVIYCTNATWTSMSSTDLETASNWNSGAGPVPDGIATFDSTLTSVFSPTDTTEQFSVDEFYFPNSASAFSFSFTGPGILNFTGPGITGLTNTNPTITAINPVSTMITLPQFLFSASSGSSSIGTATVELTNNGTIAGSAQNMAQLVLADGDDYTPNIPVIAGDELTLNIINTNSISAEFELAAQILLNESTFSAGNDLQITATNSGTMQQPSSQLGISSLLSSPSAVSSFTALDHANLNFDNSGSVDQQIFLESNEGTVSLMLGDHASLTFDSSGTIHEQNYLLIRKRAKRTSTRVLGI